MDLSIHLYAFPDLVFSSQDISFHSRARICPFAPGPESFNSFCNATTIVLQLSENMSYAGASCWAEVLDLIIIWGEVSMQEVLVASHWKKDLFVYIAKQKSEKVYNQGLTRAR